MTVYRQRMRSLHLVRRFWIYKYLFWHLFLVVNSSIYVKMLTGSAYTVSQYISWKIVKLQPALCQSRQGCGRQAVEDGR